MPRMVDIGRRGRGVSLIELMIVVSLGSLLTLGVSSLLNALNKGKRRAENLIASTGEELLGNRQLWFDLRAAGISFNFMNAGPCSPGQPDFFDYLPDVTCVPPDQSPQAINDPAKNPCMRKMTLSLPQNGEQPQSLTLAISKGSVMPALPLAPIQFYTASDPPDLYTAGTLNFQFGPFMNTLRVLNNPKPTLLEEGNVLRFYSPITMRPLVNRNIASPVAIANELDLMIPPRLVSLIAVYRQGGLVIENPRDSLWLQCQMHPTMGVDFATVRGGDTEPTLDLFWRLLPPVGGRGAFAMVTAIDIVQYRVVPTKLNGKDTGMLIREKYDGKSNKWSQSHVVAEGVSSVDFIRKTISTPSIKATINMDKKGVF